MKESVTKFNLEAAFKALDEIEIPVARKGIAANKVNLKETFNIKSKLDLLLEDYYDVNDTEELEAAKEAREAEVAKAKLARIEKIVDLNAESEEDLLPSYVGKMIIQCPQCMTLFYKNEEDIARSEEDPEVVNVNEVCQHCGNASGYSIIGKVDQVGEEEAEEYDLDAFEDENELDLDFPEGTEEVDPEGTGEDARDDELDLEPVNTEDEEETTEEDSEEAEEEVKESLNESLESNIDILIKKYIKEEEQKHVKAELIRVANAWSNLSEDEKEYWYGSNGTIGYFFDSEDAINFDTEVFNEEALENEETAEIWNKFIDVTIYNKEVNESLHEDFDEEFLDEEEVEISEEELEDEEIEETEEVDEEEEKVVISAEEVKEIAAEAGEEVAEVVKENPEVEAEEIKEITDEVVDSALEVEDETEEEVVEDEEIIEVEEDEEVVEEALTEAVDKELDDKLKAHNEYVEYLKDEIEKTEKSLENAKNDFVKKSIQSKLDALKADLEAALPEALKDEVVADELPTPEESGLEDAAENKEEKDEEVKESLNETYYACAEIDGEERRFPFNTREEAKNYIDMIQKGEAKEFEGKKIGSTWTEDLKEETKEALTENVIININVEGEKEEAPVIIPVEANVEAGCLPEAECLVEPIVEPQPEIVEEPVIEEPTVEEVETEEEISEEELEDEEVIEEACEPLTEEDNFDLSDAEAEELFNSDEFKQPISEEEVESYLDESSSFESVFEEIDELDDESIQNCICESLTEVYSNVENFVMESCEMNNGTFKINGTINFKSGNASETSYVFNEAKYITEDRIVLNGMNETLSKDGSFVLEAKVNSANKSMVANTLSYSYKINNNLVEGLIKNNK